MKCANNFDRKNPKQFAHTRINQTRLLYTPWAKWNGKKHTHKQSVIYINTKFELHFVPTFLSDFVVVFFSALIAFFFINTTSYSCRLPWRNEINWNAKKQFQKFFVFCSKNRTEKATTYQNHQRVAIPVKQLALEVDKKSLEEKNLFKTIWNAINFQLHPIPIKITNAVMVWIYCTVRAICYEQNWWNIMFWCYK